MTPDQVDVGTLVLWAAACSTMLTLGITLWNVFSSPARRQADRIEAQGKRIEDIDRAVQRLEVEISAMPSTTTMHELEVMLVRVEGRLDTLNERLQPVSSIAERMQEWMLENGK